MLVMVKCVYTYMPLTGSVHCQFHVTVRYQFHVLRTDYIWCELSFQYIRILQCQLTIITDLVYGSLALVQCGNHAPLPKVHTSPWVAIC